MSWKKDVWRGQNWSFQLLKTGNFSTIDSGFKGSRSITTRLCCDQSSNRSFCSVGTSAEPMFPNFSHPPRTASTSISTIGEWFSIFSQPGSLHNWSQTWPPVSQLCAEGGGLLQKKNGTGNTLTSTHYSPYFTEIFNNMGQTWNTTFPQHLASTDKWPNQDGNSFLLSSLIWQDLWLVSVICSDITNKQVGISGETVPGGGNLHIYYVQSHQLVSGSNILGLVCHTTLLPH